MRRKSKRLLAKPSEKEDDEPSSSAAVEPEEEEPKRVKSSAASLSRQSSETSSNSTATSQQLLISSNKTTNDSTMEISSSSAGNEEEASISSSDDVSSLASASQATHKNTTTDTNDSYLYLELKLMSIDNKCRANCVDKLISAQKYVCINSNASTSHVKRFIINKSKITENLFEIVLMCNGFEIVNDSCPLIYLKNKFFKRQETIVLYYAIIERYFKKFNSIESGVGGASSSLSDKSFT